jgi:hypothetical protein
LGDSGDKVNAAGFSDSAIDRTVKHSSLYFSAVRKIGALHFVKPYILKVLGDSGDKVNAAGFSDSAIDRFCLRWNIAKDKGGVTK